jgi:hypothetical protein
MTPAVVLLFSLAGPAPAGDVALSWDNYEAVRDHVLPRADEQDWLAVPWRSAFFDAVLEARESERPILLWAMNGHPLGCT